MKLIFTLVALIILASGCGPGKWVGGNDASFKKREALKIDQHNAIYKVIGRS
ncbi:MAG: hypothetical protein H7334_03185 [Ferruginibacter sp.]|nr:hypothetical protein [Ferruginibacter sp.]